MPRIYDNHGRIINYVRLAVTDRCNLRCFYCMPEEGINYAPKKDLLSYEEMVRLMKILAALGIEKVRITGGEPFLRRDIMDFLQVLSKMEGIRKINITTNGTLTAPLVPELKKMGIQSINLSLDTLDRQRFFDITRRDDFPKVMDTFETLLRHDMEVKLNVVVMNGKNTNDLADMVRLTKEKKVSVRFIEEMPFNGEGAHEEVLVWNHIEILNHLRSHFPDLQKIPDPPFSTAYNYQVPGYKGTVGIIAAYSRTFCGTCNRLRITPQGALHTCLYDGGVFNIRNFMRADASDEQLKEIFIQAINNRAKNGFDAEKKRMFAPIISESMATIGG
jgi:molybdenum cofactor biosynthesis protein A